MNDAPNVGQDVRAGGVAMMASGALFLAIAVLDFAIGPASGDLLAWRDAHAAAIAWMSEVLFFATILLVPATLAWHRRMAPAARFSADIAAGIMAVTITLIVALLVVHGRLIYPIYGMRADSAQMIAGLVALFYGGMHAVYLLMAAATIAASIAMRKAGYPRWMANAGFVVAATDIAGSYPWLIGATLTLVCELAFAGWLLVVGWQLFRVRRAMREP